MPAVEAVDDERLQLLAASPREPVAEVAVQAEINSRPRRVLRGSAATYRCCCGAGTVQSDGRWLVALARTVPRRGRTG